LLKLSVQIIFGWLSNPVINLIPIVIPSPL
jgi:hypothetical protein